MPEICEQPRPCGETVAIQGAPRGLHCSLYRMDVADFVGAPDGIRTRSVAGVAANHPIPSRLLLPVSPQGHIRGRRCLTGLEIRDTSLVIPQSSKPLRYQAPHHGKWRGAS